MKFVERNVVIVGGGPAGLAAAAELDRLGVGDVLLIEREHELGGIPRHCHHTGFGWFDLRRIKTGPSYAKHRSQMVMKSSVEVWTSTMVTEWADSHSLVVSSDKGRCTVKANAILLATGCRERPRGARMVPGSRPQGVLTTGALQQMLYLKNQSVGKRAVVVGAEHVSYSAVHSLRECGSRVVAMIDEHPRHQSYGLFKLMTADLHGVPTYWRSRIVEILGRGRVSGVRIRDEETNEESILECDLVVFSGNWIPDHELVRMGGLELDSGSLGPKVGTSLQTSQPHVFAAGNLCHGAEIADVAALDGVHAAKNMRDYLAGRSKPLKQVLPLSVDDPLLWVFPNVLSIGEAPPRHRFVMRSKEFLDRCQISVFQGEQRVASYAKRSIAPNKPFSIPDTWTRSIESGPLRIVSEH